MKLSQRVIYQIYPKSFKDTTGKGFGDLQGIIEKLDYLDQLGIDMVWLCPIYPSPQYDNGYDVADYKAINPDYGTMADFDQLVSEAKARNIDIMLDMVFNHVSTEHEWFQKALAGDEYYQDYFYLRPSKSDGSLPTNWDSKFGGPAWEQFGDSEMYYLHLYDVHQADLNWHNPNVRRELQEVVNFWLEKGVKGFRFDVYNVIGKDDVLVDSEEPGSSQEKLLYTDTPIVHQWHQEMNRATYGRYDDIVTVGEMSSTNIENGVKYSNPERDQLSMIFSFHHLKVDYQDGDKWSNPDFDFLALKKILDEWQSGMSEGQGWNALFWNNHDQPRANSRFGDVEKFPFESATMLAQTIHLMRGTPYIYQGEEIGMTNPNFNQIEDYRDIETHNNYQLLLERGLTESQAMEIIQAKSRDNSRTPMQWNSEAHAGFTTGQPWMKVAPNYHEVNVAIELAQGSIYAYYQELINLRRNYPIIAEGSYRSILLDHPKVLAYVREHMGEKLLVISHFYAGQVEVPIPEALKSYHGRLLIGNGSTKEFADSLTLHDYETVAFLLSQSS